MRLSVAASGLTRTGREHSEVQSGAGCPCDPGLAADAAGFCVCHSLMSEGRDEIAMIAWEDQLSAEQVGGKSDNKIS